MVENKKNSVAAVPLIMAVVYLYLYNPVLRPGFAFGTFLLLISVAFALLNFTTIQKYLKFYKMELWLSIVALLYVYLICNFNNTNTTTVLKGLFIWVLFSTLVPVFLVKVALSRIPRFVFWDFIINIGFIASIISCVALFIPSFNDFLRSVQMDISQSGGEILYEMNFRAYGFANYLTSSYGYMQGLLAAYCVLHIDNKHKRYILFFITITISVIINARTGVFPILLSVAYMAVSTVLRLKINRLFNYIFSALFVVVVFSAFLQAFPSISSFVQNFIDQITMLIIDNEYEGSAYDTMLRFPKTTSGLIFGEGYSIFSNDYDSSDIGYVNQIFVGGLIYASILLLYELIVYIKIMKRSNDKIFSTIFFISLLVFNFKGAQYCASCAFVGLWMLYYFVLVHNQVHPLNPIRLN